MQKLIAIGAILALTGVPAVADPAAPPKSERAMAPASADAGASKEPKNERAMPTAAEPGTSPNPKSERALSPDKSEK